MAGPIRRNFVSVPGGGGLDGLQTGTIAFWVKWTGIQDVFQRRDA
jgi:hypothetical protein